MVTTTRAALETRHAHESHHGFCTVCGSVWPCSRAGRTKPRVPVARSESLPG
jgi:hypothetical protein